MKKRTLKEILCYIAETATDGDTIHIIDGEVVVLNMGCEIFREYYQ